MALDQISPSLYQLGFIHLALFEFWRHTSFLWHISSKHMVRTGSDWVTSSSIIIHNSQLAHFLYYTLDLQFSLTYVSLNPTKWCISSALKMVKNSSCYNKVVLLLTLKNIFKPLRLHQNQIAHFYIIFRKLWNPIYARYISKFRPY